MNTRLGDDVAPATPSVPDPGFGRSYAGLPEVFYAKTAPTPVAAPTLIRWNAPLARALGLDPERFEAHAAAVFSGNALPASAEPIAMAYAGHQFGHFVPQLGDGRALLLGELVDEDGVPRDVQLKGAGRTPFSRGGDGRAALGPVLREYLVSEAMHALGVPTTRALAAVATGEPVYRERPYPGGVVTRVAASHVRVGTFQFFAARQDVDSLKVLADYVIARHYPELADASTPYLALLTAVRDRTAALVARWMAVAFIHGVMNTDNTSVSGETIDYGPCAFMDAYDPGTVFSSIDHQGRYAYGNQPVIAQWNLARFAETLLPLEAMGAEAAVTPATEIVSAFSDVFDRAWTFEFVTKLGLTEVRDGDRELVEGLLSAMQEAGADFTNTFRALAAVAEGNEAPFLDEFVDRAAAAAWLGRWRARLGEASGAAVAARLKRVNPAVIPRNHRVEAALEAAVERSDLGPFEDLLRVLATPFELAAGDAGYAAPPAPSERVYRTFCGT